MIVLFAFLSIIGALLIAPGWYIAQKSHPQSLWIFTLPFAGVIVWMVLTYLGIGAQSLANSVELVFVVLSAVVASYVKFLVVDRHTRMRSLGLMLPIAIVFVVTIGLRLLMPWLPE